MHSRISPEFKDVPNIAVAESILKRCVHCGFCNATCPTYQLLGDELDGPRGRIYLIKQMLEAGQVTEHSRLHLDRCLSCRSCETTCPSGVEYSRLADIGRHIIEQKTRRSIMQDLLRRTLLWWLPFQERFALLISLARLLRPVFPSGLKRKIPVAQTAGPWPIPRHKRKVLLLEGCVQSSLAPDINAAAASVLDCLGISAIRVPDAGCCGAMHYHLHDHAGAKEQMRVLIEACENYLYPDVEAIISTASGCGSMLKDYAFVLGNEPGYAEKAQRFSALIKDLSEVLSGEDLTGLTINPKKIAFQSPCSLQHSQKLPGVTETLLTRLGFTLTPVEDSHLCCGSAGTYSILQPDIAGRLRSQKLSRLIAGDPESIITANIGCLLHLQEQSSIPVLHWIQLLSQSD